MFLVLLVNLSVCPFDYLKSIIAWIYIKLSPEVCFGLRINQLHFWNDLDYDLYTGSYGLVA